MLAIDKGLLLNIRMFFQWKVMMVKLMDLLCLHLHPRTALVKMFRLEQLYHHLIIKLITKIHIMKFIKMDKLLMMHMI